MMYFQVNNGEVKVFNDSCFSDLFAQASILQLSATYSEDRKNTIGIYRMSKLSIKYSKAFEYESEANTEIWNNLCDKEYNFNDDDWKTQAMSDIEAYTGLDKESIVIM